MSLPAGSAAAGVRPVAAAGLFYPAGAAELVSTVDSLLAGAGPGPDAVAGLPALVVPHAGYRYSGSVAAAAYARIRGCRPARVVLLGPSHFVPLAGSAVPCATAWSTPLGSVRIDSAARDRAVAVPGVHAGDEPHAHEHALEVQLPFLQRSIGPGVPVLPVATGASPDEIGHLLDAVTSDAPTLVVVSTDLSHYLPDEDARAWDARTVQAVLELRPDRVGSGSACGASALRGLLAWARGTGLSPSLLAYATSAEAGADPRRVVGYGAFSLS
ncbi:MAG: AmmeMemoRadiSam system protein B [Mycobacteriales bacterium]